MRCVPILFAVNFGGGGLLVSLIAIEMRHDFLSTSTRDP